MNPFIFSILPLLIFVFLLIFKKMRLVHASFFTLFSAILISIFFWKILPITLLNSFVKGFFVALDIFFIICGAILFLGILEKRKTVENIIVYLSSLSKDIRVQTIVLAWLFEGFIEGVAGFGIPSALVAPVLIKMGFSTIAAVSLSLLGNSVSVAFGAAGTPIRVGLAGLYQPQIPLYTALLCCYGFIIPLFMLYEAVKERENPKKLFIEAVPFALFSGIVYVGSLVVGTFLGQEFPSIIGSIIAIAIIGFCLKFKILLPKEEGATFKTIKGDGKKVSILNSAFPYVLLISLLILGKFLLGGVSFNIIPSINQKINLFNPGYVFIISSLLMSLFWKIKRVEFLKSLSKAAKKTVDPLLVIFFMSVFVQIINLSGVNSSGMPSMLQVLAGAFENKFLPLWTPFVGLFGSFMTGSATISNIMFGNFLDQASRALGFAPEIILALSTSGAAIGNIIALGDIMTAEAVVGIKNKELAVVKRVLAPTLIITLLIAITGLLVT